MTFVTVRRTCTRVRTMHFHNGLLAGSASCMTLQRRCIIASVFAANVRDSPLTLPNQHDILFLLHHGSHCCARNRSANNPQRNPRAELN